MQDTETRYDEVLREIAASYGQVIRDRCATILRRSRPDAPQLTTRQLLQLALEERGREDSQYLNQFTSIHYNSD